MLSKKPKLYLASESPRRHALLRQYGIPFTVIPNLLLNEILPQRCHNIRPFLRQLATEKVMTSKNGFEGIILGVDTSVLWQDEILGKPRDLEEAQTILKKLSGKTHDVISGFCLLDTRSGKKITRTETSQVTFNALDKETINVYCQTYKPLDKAGSYGIQDCPEILIKHLKGSVENVMGLPIKTLQKALRELHAN
ncbi:MAG: septum formation protein Maf [Candidatus Margulisbacteria bacterium]|nr:septum formation protein Maf [Candidatus Margulisiibacteriota bacterium]